MLAARGRGAAVVAAAVRGALRGEHPDADHAPLFPRLRDRGLLAFCICILFFSSPEDAAVITKVREPLGEVLRLAFVGPLCRSWVRYTTDSPAPP